MTVLSYKVFMEEVRARLGTFTNQDLQSLILSWARKEYPSNRQEFLDKLMLPGQKELIYDANTLINKIEEFAKRVEDGQYCSGWGWDDAIQEERDWGVESWAEEMDEFFLQARSLLLRGEYLLAEEAYEMLLSILEMGQEPGYLPGDPDHDNMLKVDVDEQVAAFFMSVYMNSASGERPASLYEAMKRYGYLANKVNLRSIIDISDSSLPDFDIFLAEKYPMAYIDWIAALEMKNDTKSVIQVAREGMSRIPRDYTIRAKVAETISRIGEKLNDNNLKLEGYVECFYSNPSIKYLLNLYTTAMECGKFEEVCDKAEQRIMELQDKSRMHEDDYYNREQNTSFVSDGILFNTLLLGGRYEKAFEMCKGSGPLGWSYSENSKPLFVTFMMVVLSKKETYSKVLIKQWEDAIGTTSYGMGKDYIEKHKKIISGIKESMQLNSEQEEFYLKWCKDEIGCRIDAIVSNQYRGSYPKAAGLLVAMAETLANRGEKQEGMDLIERYKNRYPRHIAFKSKITQALKISDLLNARNLKN